ncbi:MAG: hypothetical protein JWP27_2686 [Flaviaesturariibacter sp.]|nr:hypothetical protein [Flaviaesturariibacter sp.]
MPVTMTRNTIIATRLREVFLDGKWIANTNYQDLLRSIDWQQAIQKVGDLNTIAALTFHINYYLEGLISALKTGRLAISDRYSFDLPDIQTEADWSSLVSGFVDNSETFATLVERMDDSTFDRPFVDEAYGTYWRNIEGVIEHSYYHLGQISLLRKMIAANRP